MKQLYFKLELGKSSPFIFALLTSCLIILSNSEVHAQKRMFNWYFGSNISFEWDCTNSYTFSSTVNPINSFSTPASVSDEDGNFQFAVNATHWTTVGQQTDGGIYDRTGNLMPISTGGTADLAQNVSGSSGCVVAFPVSANIWYAFYSYSLNVQSGDYYYSIIDMSLPGNGTVANPAGEVIEHRTYFFNSSKFSFTAARHDNGSDYWVTIAETNQIHAYQVSLSGGIANPVTTQMAIIPSGNNLYKVSDMQFSPDGSKLAYQWGVIDFDISTGVFSNIQHIPSAGLNVFSPSCEYLYRGKKAWPSGENYILRYETNNLTSNSLPLDTIAIHNVNSNSGAWAPDWASKGVLHSDGNIYFKDGTYGDMSVIHNPNSLGAYVNINEIIFSGNGSWWSSNYDPGSWGFGSLPHFVTSWAVEVTAESISDTNILVTCDSSVFEFTGEHCGLVTTEEWHFGDGTTAIGNNPTHAYLNSGTYEVLYIVRNDSTCSKWNTDTLSTFVTVTNAGQLVPTIEDSTLVLCSQGPVFDLTATPNVGVWSGPGISDSINGFFDPSLAGPGTHEIYFNTTGNCAGQDVTQITVLPSDTANFSYSSVVFCPTDSPQTPLLPIPPGYIFSTSSGLAIDTITGVIDIPNSLPGTYDISLTTNGSCPATITQSIEIETPPVVYANNANGCEGSSNSILFSGTANEYLWNNLSTVDYGFGLAGTGDIVDFIATLPSGVEDSMLIEILPESSYGCLGHPDTMQFTINTAPEVSFTADNIQGCAPVSVNFSNTSIGGAHNQWTLGDGTVIFDEDYFSHVYDAGIFDVTLSVTSAEGCTSSTTHYNYINISAPPVADFQFSPHEIDIEDPQVTFHNLSQNASSYSWDFGDGSPFSNEEDPIHTYDYIPDNYSVVLYASNSDGSCVDSTKIELAVLDVVTYFVPNSFTPDGDEHNQVFKPVFNDRIDFTEYSLIVFNRWGQVVFESHDPAIGWDGTYANQGVAQAGTYVWKIQFKDENNGLREMLNGHVNLIK